VYRASVAGDEAEAIEASIAEARKSYDRDQQIARGKLLRELAMASVDELEAMYGDDIKPLLERLKGRAPSIGQPSNAGKQPSPPNPNKAIEDMTDEEFRAQMAREGVRFRG
jgi:hypothetical protein